LKWSYLATSSKGVQVPSGVINFLFMGVSNVTGRIARDFAPKGSPPLLAPADLVNE
jgi:hypothetical protein